MSIVSPRGFVSTSIKPGSEEVLLPPIPLQPPRELMFSLYSNLGVEDVNLELLELANGFSKQWHGGEVLPIDGWMGTTWKERMEKDILEYKPGGDRDSIIAYWMGNQLEYNNIESTKTEQQQMQKGYTFQKNMGVTRFQKY